MFSMSSCSSDEEGEQVSSRAYKGHESDLDVNNFVAVYPETVGTRLDDCQTCHRGGLFTDEVGGETFFVNACDYCHLINHPSEDFIETQPAGYADSLNPYGAAYSQGGRDQAALRAIAGEDSDGDGANNEEEIADLKYPGDPDSKPGQQSATGVILNMAELKAMNAHEQFLLCNSHKQEFDNYASYQGVKFKDLLAAAGVDLQDAAIQGITVIAPDGYQKDFTKEDIESAFPASLYYAGRDTATLGTECGYVQYPDTLPDGLTNGLEIPGEQWLLLAYQRDGMAMDPSLLDNTSGKITGEGPYRIIVPQSVPGEPDRGSRYSPTDCADGHDYDDARDHNAGDMVRGVMAIRVNPLPAGTEDFDAKYGGWTFVSNEEVFIYGHGVTAD